MLVGIAVDKLHISVTCSDTKMRWLLRPAAFRKLCITAIGGGTACSFSNSSIPIPQYSNLEDARDWLEHGWFLPYVFQSITNSIEFLPILDESQQIISNKIMNHYAKNDKDDFRWLDIDEKYKAEYTDNLQKLLSSAASPFKIRGSFHAPWSATPFYYRAIPSGGARHPTELFAILPLRDAGKTALCHYNVLKGAWIIIECLSEPFNEAISKFSLLEKRRPHGSKIEAVFVISSILKKNAYRYREPRTFRSVLIDAGHAVSAIVDSIEADKWKSEISFGSLPDFLLDAFRQAESGQLPICAIGAYSHSTNACGLFTCRPEPSSNREFSEDRYIYTIRCSNVTLISRENILSFNTADRSLRQIKNSKCFRDNLIFDSILFSSRASSTREIYFDFLKYYWDIVKPVIQETEAIQFLDDYEGHRNVQNVTKKIGNIPKKVQKSKMDITRFFNQRRTCRSFQSKIIDEQDVYNILLKSFANIRRAYMIRDLTKDLSVSAGLGLRVYSIVRKSDSSTVFEFDISTLSMQPISNIDIGCIDAIFNQHKFILRASCYILLCQEWSLRMKIYNNSQAFLNIYCEMGMLMQEILFYTWKRGLSAFQTPALLEEPFHNILGTNPIKLGCLYGAAIGTQA